jgi:hypothetical protein
MRRAGLRLGKATNFRVALIWARLQKGRDRKPRTQTTLVRLCLQVTAITVLREGMGKVSLCGPKKSACLDAGDSDFSLERQLYAGMDWPSIVDHGRDNHHWLPPVQTRTSAH